MKKLFRTVMVLSMASLTVLTSCKKDDKSDVADATIDINAKVDGIAINDGAHVMTGKTIKFTIISTGNSDNKLKSITMSTTASSTPVLATKSLSGTSATDTPSFTVSTTGNISFTVSLTSEKGTVTKSFTVVGTAAGGPVTPSSGAIPLFAQLVNQSAHFMNLTSNFAQYNTDEFTANKTNIDLVFYYGQTNKFTFTGPQDATMQSQIYQSPAFDWTGTSTTQLAKTTLTATDFENVISDNSDAAIVAADAGATYSSFVNNLNAGDVLVYKTNASTKNLGLILVTAKSGSTNTDAEIDFRLVYQSN